jgi:hypothetical protein
MRQNARNSEMIAHPQHHMSSQPGDAGMMT